MFCFMEMKGKKISRDKQQKDFSWDENDVAVKVVQMM